MTTNVTVVNPVTNPVHVASSRESLLVKRPFVYQYRPLVPLGTQKVRQDIVHVGQDGWIFLVEHINGIIYAEPDVVPTLEIAVLNLHPNGPYFTFWFTPHPWEPTYWQYAIDTKVNIPMEYAATPQFVQIRTGNKNKIETSSVHTFSIILSGQLLKA